MAAYEQAMKPAITKGPSHGLLEWMYLRQLLIVQFQPEQYGHMWMK